MTVAKFMGVYATSRNPGARSQAGASRKRHWFVWDDGVGQYRVQLLDAAFQPLDEPRIIEPAEFFASFEHEPHILVTPVRQLEIATPEDADAGEFDDLMPSANTRATRGNATVLGGNAPQVDRQIRQWPSSQEASKKAESSRGKTPEAETDFSRSTFEKAEELDRELRTEFALALTRWRRGGQQSALTVFEKLANREAGLIPAHKHMFTDFAIDLRKSKLYTLAEQHFSKAVALAPEDSNAHFNLARIYFETGQIDKAREELRLTLTLTPVLAYAQQFMDYLDRDHPVKAPSVSSPNTSKTIKLSFSL